MMLKPTTVATSGTPPMAVFPLRTGILRHSCGIEPDANREMRGRDGACEPVRMAEFDGKTVLITGGGSGIGLATARQLVGAGANVVLAGRRVEKLDAAAKELDPKGERVLAVGTDVTRLDELDNLISRTRDTFGTLDGIFSNAGVAMAFSIPRDFSEAEFDQVVSTNYKGTFWAIQKASQILNDGGSIVVNATCLVHRGMGLAMGLATAYSTTKAAVANMARALSAEFALRRIRVNSISPGFIDTDMFDELAPIDDIREMCRSQVPLGRLGVPEDVADTVAFLLSSRSSYITGQDLGIDGGLVATAPIPVQV